MTGSWYFVNDTTHEYVLPSKYTNVKEPVESPYSAFITYMLQNEWFMSEEVGLLYENSPYLVVYDEDRRYKNITEESWGRFLEMYPEFKVIK